MQKSVLITRISSNFVLHMWYVIRDAKKMCSLIFIRSYFISLFKEFAESKVSSHKYDDI